MLEDKERKCLWIGTEGELICLRYGRAESIPLFQDNSVKSLAFDVDRNLLIGTDNGLYIYNPATGNITICSTIHVIVTRYQIISFGVSFLTKILTSGWVQIMAYPLPAILILIYSYLYGN